MTETKLAPYRVERTGAPGGIGYGRGWVAVHQPTQTGVHRRTWLEAITWTMHDHQWRADRERVRRQIRSAR